jgi:hypothetical protein
VSRPLTVPNEHVGVDKIIVDHDHGLLELGLCVENGVHLLAGIIVELNHLPQQVKTALNGLLVPGKKIMFFVYHKISQ